MRRKYGFWVEITTSMNNLKASHNGKIATMKLLRGGNYDFNEQSESKSQNPSLGEGHKAPHPREGCHDGTGCISIF